MARHNLSSKPPKVLPQEWGDYPRGVYEDEIARGTYWTVAWDRAVEAYELDRADSSNRFGFM